MKRIFSVRLNLDDMAASLEFLEGDASLADWLRGFRYGLRGAPSRWDGGPGAAGFRIGASALAEAHEFQLAKSDGGKKSAEARKEKTGTAQPSRTRLEDTSNTLRTQLEDTSVKNDNSSNQSLIVNLQSTNVDQNGEREALPPQSPPAPRSKRFVPPTVAEVDGYALASGYSIDAVKFVAYWEAADWMRGKTKISNWKMAVVTWTRNNFDKAKGGAPVQLEGAFVQAHNFDEAYAAIEAGERMHNEAAKERAAKQEQSK